MVEEVLHWLAELPAVVTYVVLGCGAALENVIPPVPADTFVLFGGFLAARGRADPWVAFLVTWLANVTSAVAVYAFARRHGDFLGRSRPARWFLAEHQLRRIGVFYERWGASAIFLSRFLPGLRAVVPVFAGISRLSAPRMVIPTFLASGLWYGGLVYVGATAGRNWEAIQRALANVNSGLLVLTLVIAAAMAAWWWRTRRE